MKKKDIILLMAALLFAFVVAIPVSGVSSASVNSTEYVIIDLSNVPSIEALENNGVDIAQAYDSFVLAEVDSSRIPVLEGLGLNIRALGDRNMVGLDDYSFFTDASLPSIPEDLKISSYSGTGVYIVQFIGPVSNDWIMELESSGVVFETYIPRYNYIVRMDSSLEKVVESKNYVNWVGIYQPAYKVSPELLNRDASVPVTIYTYPDVDLSALSARLEDMGIAVGSTWHTSVHGGVLAIIDGSDEMKAVARLMEVEAIKERYPAYLVNADATWIHQTNTPGSRTLFDHGVTGEGIIVTEMDSQLELDHEMFYDPNHANAGPDHRKVLDMYVVGGGDLSDGNYHGQHVAGTICGDAPETEGGTDWLTYNKQDGNAYAAKLIFQDIDPSDDTYGSVSPPDDMRDGYWPSYNASSRIHTNSWGGGNGYTDAAIQTDDFIFTHQDYSVLFAMGNSGDGANTISAQPEGKSTISVGAIENVDGPNGNQNDMASFSSRGYADDGRIKPTICTVGDSVTSADKTDGTANNGDETSYHEMSGTSMATPGAAGLVALIRQYYQDGYWPSGQANADDSIWPTSALVKATLVNSGEEMTGDGAYKNDNRYPNGDQGWGRANLDSTLYFAGDSKTLKIFDNSTVPCTEPVAQFTATGQSVEYQVWVDNPNEPLEITLAWNDYPGASQTNPEIVNDLDLIVTGPNGEYYWGNVYTGTNPGHSVESPSASDAYSKWDASGDGHDDINVVESVLLVPGHNTINTGKYTIKVVASNIANLGSLGYQPFAVVATGGLDITPPSFSGAGRAVDNENRDEITISWPAASDPAAPITYNIYRSTTPGGEDFSHPTYCGVSGTSFTDTNVAPGQIYYYVVRAVDDAYNEDSNTVEVTNAAKVSVEEGWNLISLPWLDTPTSLSDALDGLSWERAMVYQNGHWYTYNVNRDIKFNVGFPMVDNTMGIWVYASSSGEKLGVGVAGTTDIALHEGWNLVGFPSQMDSTVSDAMSGFTGQYDLIQTFDPTTGQIVSVSGSDAIRSGSGYWVHVTSAGTWSVDW